MKTTLLIAATSLVISGQVFADMYGYGGSSVAAVPKDGELSFPADYKTWPKFLHGIQRADLKQIRDIYINPQGQKSSRPFAYGTVSVMELHSVKVDGDGKPLLDTDGKLQKQALTKVFVMAKGAGWGQDVPPEQRNGEWVYASFDPSGKSLGKDMGSCRTCHAPLKEADFMARLPQYQTETGR